MPLILVLDVFFPFPGHMPPLHLEMVVDLGVILRISLLISTSSDERVCRQASAVVVRAHDCDHDLLQSVALFAQFQDLFAVVLVVLGPPLVSPNAASFAVRSVVLILEHGFVPIFYQILLC